jgi:hypothetical protein
MYLHAIRERGEAIAAGMGQLLKDARKQGTRPRRIRHAAGTPPQAGFVKISE